MIKVERLPIEDVAFRSTNYIKALDNVKAGWREEMLRYIDEAAVDDGVATNHRIRYIVQKLVDNNCRQCVKTLFIVAKKS